MRKLLAVVAAFGLLSSTLGPVANAAPLSPAAAAGQVGRAGPGVDINDPNAVVSAISDGAGHRYLFWRTSSERLMEAKYNGHSWSTSLVPGIKGVLSRPTASFSWVARGIYVFWMGLPPHMDLMEAYFTNRWHGPINLGMGPLGGPPSAPPTWFGDNGGGVGPETVVWETENRQLGYATAFDPTNKKSWRGPFTDRAIKSMTRRRPSSMLAAASRRFSTSPRTGICAWATSPRPGGSAAATHHRLAATSHPLAATSHPLEVTSHPLR